MGKAPLPVRGEFRFFVEGGAFWTGGDPIPFEGEGGRGIGFPIAFIGGGFNPSENRRSAGMLR